MLVPRTTRKYVTLNHVDNACVHLLAVALIEKNECPPLSVKEQIVLPCYGIGFKTLLTTLLPSPMMYLFEEQLPISIITVNSVPMTMLLHEIKVLVQEMDFSFEILNHGMGGLVELHARTHTHTLSIIRHACFSG